MKTIAEHEVDIVGENPEMDSYNVWKLAVSRMCDELKEAIEKGDQKMNALIFYVSKITKVDYDTILSYCENVDPNDKTARTFLTPKQNGGKNKNEED